MVEVYAWNPKRPIIKGRIGRRIPLKKNVNNFGDLLGPIVVKGMLNRLGLTGKGRDARLLSVGSVLHQARDGDVIWGTGRNGKISDTNHVWQRLDVRAVRGPRTHRFLEAHGIHAPRIFGDPALLLPFVAPTVAATERTSDVVVVPNYNDVRFHRHDWPTDIVRPTRPTSQCLSAITSGRLVVGSSLHAIVVAEAFGIPARAIQSAVETDFKYLDYYEGTGRRNVKLAATVDEAVSLGGVEPPEWDPVPLMDAFPSDLWR